MHTGLGPYGYGEPICNHAPGGERVRRARAWWGDSVTEPLLGTSTSQEKWGLTDEGYARCLSHAELTFVFLEFGTYSRTQGRAVPPGGPSPAQEKGGLTEFGCERALAHADIAFVALEFGTYPEARGTAVLRDEQWLHAHGDPLGAEADAIRAATRDHFYPPHDDWKEMVLFRAWQVWRQGLAGLAAS